MRRKKIGEAKASAKKIFNVLTRLEQISC